MNVVDRRRQPTYLIATLIVAVAIGLGGRALYPVVSSALFGEEQAATAEVPGGEAIGGTRVTALGRLEPKDGILRLAGPSRPSVVLSRLLVDKGDRVRAGQVVAVLDEYEPLEATVARLHSELEYAESERQRHEKLYQNHVVSVSERDIWRLKVNTLQADLRRAEVELDHASVRAPMDGQVLQVHARAGEKVGPAGILELAKTDQMYAIAEVYESDIGRVRLGQRATVTSPALEQPVYGAVERIGLQIGRLDAIGTDPIARTDARVVEVEVRLDDSQTVAALTYLQVEVVITP
jgi:HlyD family secretion protein